MGKIPSREEQEGAREFDNPRSRSGQEARIVCGCQSEDFKGNKGEVGEVQGREEQERVTTVSGESERGSWQAAELV